MNIKYILLGLLSIFLISGASAWDMGDPTTGAVNSISSDGLIGKTVHIVQLDDDCNYHIVTKITGISFGMLQTSDIYTSGGYRNTIPTRYTHHNGIHWISIASILDMWEESLPTESEESVPSQSPGFDSILAISGILAVAYIGLRRKA